jgi:uncharacterized protein
MIVDCHVHILNAEDRHLRELLNAADRAGVDKLCICSLSRQWAEFPSAEALSEAADDVRRACAKHPDRFTGFVYVSADHAELSLRLMDEHIANGPCQPVKWWISQLADDPRLDPIVERAIELGVPIMAHSWVKAMGNMSKESTYRHVLNMARRFPQAKLWFAHYSGRWEESARAAADVPNVCMDLSGGEPEAGILECLLKHVGPERIFYGSDAPGRCFVTQMSKVLEADLPEAQRRMILGENIRRWIRV